jgi:alkylated DNA repair dioxygenase AlkB
MGITLFLTNKNEINCISLNFGKSIMAAEIYPVPTAETLINQDGAIALIIRNWLPPSYATKLHDYLVQGIPWKAEQMQMYGKTFDIPRTMFFVGDSHVKTYSYSRLSFPVESWDGDLNPLYSEIRVLRDRIRSDPNLRHVTGTILEYNSCLLNHYRNGMDKIDAHSDREALGPANAVVTISLGASRQFHFKSKSRDENGNFRTIKTVLNNGDLVLMAGKCQEHWTHLIPREPAITQSRISLTYRLIKS